VTRHIASVAAALLALSTLACERGKSAEPEGTISSTTEAIVTSTNTASCPASGGEMIRTAAGFCIDRTEVTQSSYASWLAQNPTTNGQAKHCAWNSDYKPTCSYSPSTTPDKPVVCVDWCDAVAFCQAAGKRLCGGIKKVNEDQAPVQSSTSEWQIACRQGTPTHNGAFCQGWRSSPHTTRIVAAGSCTSNEGVSDMIGNVWEWADSCVGRSTSTEECRVHGGSFVSADPYLDCEIGAGHQRIAKEEDLGFRCCAD
jgi:formylglycine-generating enzyme